MRTEGVLEIAWTRAELVAVREAIEVTPLFDGRVEVRDTLKRALYGRRRAVSLDAALGERLAAHLVPVDMQTAVAKVKLLRAIRDLRRAHEPAGQADRAA